MISASRKRWLPLTALLLALPACGGDAAFRPAPVVEGYYTLRQVDGRILPRIVSNDGASRVEIMSGDVELDESSWVGRTEFRITTPGGVTLDTQVGSGQWSFHGDSIRFDAAGAVMGVSRGDTLRIVRRTSGIESIFVYTR